MSRCKRGRLFGFSERLQESFRASGMTVVDFAGKIGKERKVVYAYINADAQPDTYPLARICIALDVSADWLLFGKKNDS